MCISYKLSLNDETGSTLSRDGEFETGEAKALLLQANPGPITIYHYCNIFAVLAQVELVRPKGHVVAILVTPLPDSRSGSKGPT